MNGNLQPDDPDGSAVVTATKIFGSVPQLDYPKAAGVAQKINLTAAFFDPVHRRVSIAATEIELAIRERREECPRLRRFRRGDHQAQNTEIASRSKLEA
jgi:hypothetical protein